MCAVCRGRGEVEAGITGETVEHGPAVPCLDWRGRTYFARSSYPTAVMPNPAALVMVQTGNRATEYRDVYILQQNPLVPLWGIAVCARCHGSGLEPRSL